MEPEHIADPPRSLTHSIAQKMAAEELHEATFPPRAKPVYRGGAAATRPAARSGWRIKMAFLFGLVGYLVAHEKGMDPRPVVIVSAAAGFLAKEIVIVVVAIAAVYLLTKLKG